MTLKDLQQDVQSFILSENHAVIDAIAQPATVHEPLQRLTIYRHSYFLRLKDVLYDDFKIIVQQIGEEKFAQLAYQYLSVYPSNHFSVQTIGQQFANFLHQKLPERDDLFELAQYAWSTKDLLNINDAPRLKLQNLAMIDPEAWSDLQFNFHESVQSFFCHFNQKIYLIWQADFEIYFQIIDEATKVLFSTLAAGNTLAQCCEIMLQFFTENEAPNWVATVLQQWIEQKMFNQCLQI